MPTPRSRVVDDNASSLYHCISRCVRRLFLLESANGDRREWIASRIYCLATAFGIDTVSMAIMGNHLHVILRTLPEVVATWSDREVAYRWLLICPNRRRRRKLGLDPDGPPHELEIDLLCGIPGRIQSLRRRLSSLSWFMKKLKEPLARVANAEEGIDGNFWQGRFKCHRLLDDTAVLCCATYVDMNPVAAGVCSNALAAPFTSVAEHLRRLGRESGPTDSEESLEAFARQFDDVLFEPAVPCRRAPYLESVAEGPTADHAPRTTTCAAIDGTAVAATDDSGAASAADPSHSTPLTDEHATCEVGAPSESPNADRPARPAPPQAVLRITLGQYFRRLAELSSVTATAQMRSRAESGTDASADGDRAFEHVPVQAILDGVTPTAEVLAALVQHARFWGTAIGSTSNLVTEAIRRRAHRVVCALR